MELVRGNDPILTKPCMAFDFLSPPFDPIEFAQDLVKTMYENNGIGLAANQVGVPYRIFAMRGEPQNFAVYNPRIVWYSDDQVMLHEGCLSYPGLDVKIKRPAHIKVRFNTPNGDVETRTFTGLSARIFQHEYDHLMGVRFFDKANRFHRDQAMRKWRQREHLLHIERSGSSGAVDGRQARSKDDPRVSAAALDGAQTA